ncbi:MAG: hypothetical protein ABI947_26215 [Chloroflexota bacterium]
MKAPFYDWRTWRRVLLKAVLCLLICDALFIVLRPLDRLMPLSLFGSLLPYRTRIAIPERDVTGQLVPLETLLNAHIISRPKAANEYRVIILGDSGINGWGNRDSETINAYLEAAGKTLGGKTIRAYNLAALGPSVSRDLVIADAALAYQPDLIVWFVTLQSFHDATPDRLLEFNQPRLTRLTQQFKLNDVNARTYGHYEAVWWQRSILMQRTTLYRWLSFQAYSLRQGQFLGIYPLAQTDPIPASPVIAIDDPAYTPMPNAAWAALTALPQLTHSPILIVNEPIMIVKGSPANYNEFNGREIYDLYRSTFNRTCTDQRLWCMDLWDLLPMSEYTDSPLHRTAQGNAAIATRVMNEIGGVLDK